MDSEIAKFDELADVWWDSEGPLKTLHHINPVRLAYLQSQTALANKKLLDVGCGGGILSESLARAGAKVTALDLSEKAIAVAKAHAGELAIDYRCQSIEDFVNLSPQSQDVIVCMELLEHVNDPAAFLSTLVEGLAPGGTLHLSTINRTPQSYAEAILAAEYLLGLLPKQTHDYRKFIKPSELARVARDLNLRVVDITGMRYDPFSAQAWLDDKVAVNYLMTLRAND